MKFRKETYIKQTKKNNRWYFEVRVPNCPTKTFSELKWATPENAFDKAIEYRNLCLTDDSMAHKINQTKSLREVFEESIDLFPIREKTKKVYEYRFDKYIGNDNKPIDEITRTDIINSLNAMVSTCTDEVIFRIHGMWKKIFKTAIVNEYVTTDLTIGIPCPKSQIIKENKEKIVITTREKLDEVILKIREKFKSDLEKESVCTALEVMWYLGLRPAETFALSTKDIEDGYLLVNKQLGSEMADSKHSGKLITIRKCKTDASIRKIPIPKKLKEILANYNPPCEEIMFPNRHLSYFNISDLGLRIKKLDDEFNMYQLRHTLCTRLIMKGVDQRTIMEILGHENFNMSLYYARSKDDIKASALEEQE